MIDLSVLICSTHTRWQTFGQNIQAQVWTQYGALPPEYQERVEILMLTDNKAMMLGQKRNIMVDAAQGRYVVFVDDDDRIDLSYLMSLLDATDADADVITFLVSVSLNGGTPKLCRYSKDFRRDANTRTGYERLPNHICAVKRELAAKVSFPNVAYGEDSAYSKLLLPHLRTEHHIPRVLYHYDYSAETTETQQARAGKPRLRPNQPPVADVVILSKANDPKMRKMTQTAIDTCIAGANSLPVNVIVVEHGRARYSDAAQVIYMPPTKKFNYNLFANTGACHGSAPWIVIANNDLIFTDGWLHALLASGGTVVSPKNPSDPRQRHITENTEGYNNAEHFSGWCFMLRREIWQRIRGFDEDVTFWCSDDAVIEQVKAIGVPPMLVPSSTVKHLASVTLKQSPLRDELTWANVEKFNRKYGRNKFADDPRYAEWKAKQRVNRSE